MFSLLALARDFGLFPLPNFFLPASDYSALHGAMSELVETTRVPASLPGDVFFLSPAHSLSVVKFSYGTLKQDGPCE